MIATVYNSGIFNDPPTRKTEGTLTVTNEKKALRGDSKTARWLQYAGAKNFRPDADPVPEGTGRPKFNQLNIVTTFTYRPRLVKIDAHKLTQFRVIVVTDPQTNKKRNPQTGPITICCAAASAQCNEQP